MAIFIAAHISLRLAAPKADAVLLPGVAALTLIGLTVIFRLDPHKAYLQLAWIGVGAAFFVLIVSSLKDYGWLARRRYIIGVLGVLFLMLAIVFGREVNGARLWIQFGPLHYQPSELAKVLLVIFFAAYLADRKELIAASGKRVAGMSIPSPKYFGPLVLMWGLSLLMLFLQRDLGSSLIFFGIFLAVLYTATSRKLFVALGVVLFMLAAGFAYMTLGHVRNRVTIWRHPLDKQLIDNESYQLAQSMFSIAEGGMTGRGLGRGAPGYIPDVETDFIFSAIAEELGLAGALVVLLLFLLVVGRGLKIAVDAPDDFGKLLAAGLTSIIALQAFVIAGGVTRLIPLTGVTLPFVSYGGSSILSNFILLALLMRVSDAGARAISERGEVGREGARRRRTARLQSQQTEVIAGGR